MATTRRKTAAKTRGSNTTRPKPAKTAKSKAATSKAATSKAARSKASASEVVSRAAAKTAGSTTAKRVRKAVRKPAATKRPARRPNRAPRALSLHVGLNAVDPNHYAGWSGELFACEFDANDMANLARSKGMTPTVLLTRAATRRAVLAEIRGVADELRAGDLFLLTYSGHGGQVPDANDDEDDHRDETFCLFDGQLIDDELYLALGRFAKGVRVLVLSDSCHSGTVVRARVDAPVFDADGRPDAIRETVYVQAPDGDGRRPAPVAPAGGRVRRRYATRRR